MGVLLRSVLERCCERRSFMCWAKTEDCICKMANRAEAVGMIIVVF